MKQKTEVSQKESQDCLKFDEVKVDKCQNHKY